MKRIIKPPILDDEKYLYCISLEIEALNDVLRNGFDIKDSDLYVAGYFLDSGYLFL